MGLKCVVLSVALSSALLYLANPLANLPSQAGPTIAQIAAMGDNAWLNLGSPEADAQWGTARGRSYSPRMVYAPDKNGIFLCATGIHGFVKPDGHYMDDLWFYDINAHKWICLYPGAGTPASDNPLALKLDAHGLEVDSQGNANPVSYLSHGYCNMTYNPDSSFYTIMYTECYWWWELPQRCGWLGLDSFSSGVVSREITAPRNVLYWDVNAGKWMRRYSAAGPSSGYEARHEGVVEYLPTIKKMFYKYKAETWLYDYATNGWSKSNAGVPKVDIDFQGCYDSNQNWVYVAHGSDLFFYDVEKDRYDTVYATNPVDVGGSSSYYASTNSMLNYDSVNDVLVAFIRRPTQGSTPGIYVYSFESNGWTRVGDFAYDKADRAYDEQNGCYVPELNAHFIFSAHDSWDNGNMIVYRYRKTPLSVEKTGVAGCAGKVQLKLCPSPFNPETKIVATGIATAVKAECGIYDLAGHEISRFETDGLSLRNGVAWKPGNIAAGVYVVRLTVDSRQLEARGFYIR